MKEREEESEEGDGWNEGGGRGKRGRRISWKFPAKYYRDENVELKGRLHELKKVLFSAPKVSDLLHTGPKLELKTGPF